MMAERLDTSRPFAAWDAAVLLRLMWEAWNSVFRRILGQAERTLVSELREIRNRWAHQEPFSTDDAYRALDSAGRLLTAISAPEAAEVEKIKMELLRVRFDEQVRSEKRRAAGTAIESVATGGGRRLLPDAARAVQADDEGLGVTAETVDEPGQARHRLLG